MSDINYIESRGGCGSCGDVQFSTSTHAIPNTNNNNCNCKKRDDQGSEFIIAAQVKDQQRTKALSGAYQTYTQRGSQ